MEAASQQHPEIDAELRTFAETEPDADLRLGLKAIRAADPAAAIGAYRRFAERCAKLPDSWQQTVRHGPLEGHPIWHIANPYFAIWSTATEDQDPQGNWRDNKTFNVERDTPDVLASYEAWLESDIPARAPLLNLLSRLELDTTRVLDIGCGFGEWLRFLAEKGGIPIQNLNGVDFHRGRVAETQRQLIEAAVHGGRCNGDPAAIVKNNIRQQDSLQLRPGENLSIRDVDVITLFVVTGCFNDDELDRLVGGIAAFSPKYIFTTTVTSRWKMWHGRLNEADFFARHGFRETERHWLPEKPSLNPLSALALPRRYWANLSVRIYQPS
ncbi:MAG: class I SAM-dependent methyltransferase [Proteobacteria bacterium]|nr:class I SAM-dependent methyltransferase [Pseudomonadota bacterium]